MGLFFRGVLWVFYLVPLSLLLAPFSILILLGRTPNTPVGAESYHVNMDATRGGDLPPVLDTTFSKGGASLPSFAISAAID